MVVIARHDHDLGAAPSALADRASTGRGRGERVAERALAQLEHVAEQHQPVDAGERLEQRARGSRRAQHVAPRARAEVQVRDDQRAHRSATR